MRKKNYDWAFDKAGGQGLVYLGGVLSIQCLLPLLDPFTWSLKKAGAYRGGVVLLLLPAVLALPAVVGTRDCDMSGS